MKKLIILITIFILGIFSNIAYADVMIPWENCYEYNKSCYNKCLESWEYKRYVDEKWFCIDRCCTRDERNFIEGITYLFNYCWEYLIAFIYLIKYYWKILNNLLEDGILVGVFFTLYIVKILLIYLLEKYSFFNILNFSYKRIFKLFFLTSVFFPILFIIILKLTHLMSLFNLFLCFFMIFLFDWFILSKDFRIKKSLTLSLIINIIFILLFVWIVYIIKYINS